MARAGIVLAFAVSGIVVSEPAPVDLVMLALIALVPLAGLARLAPGMTLQFMIWLGVGAGALIASSVSREIGNSASHTGVSFYLYVSFLMLAAFVAHSPERHTRLILRTWIAAALVAALAGLAGYFHAFPGAFEHFTKYGRAAGTFKDPNVLGPFLVPPILYLADGVLGRGARRPLVKIAIMLVLVLALLLSFSRGAWISLTVAFVTYGLLRLVCESSPQARGRLLSIAGFGLLAAVIGFLVVSQIDQVATLLAERSSLTQDYDVGPQGRFGGHQKAMGLAILNPLGLGAKQFAAHYHPEDVHNVYLSMFLNAGWLGGLLYIAGVASTLWAGVVHLARWTPTRTLFLVAFAAFLGNVIEGSIIDTDHWRHFYFLLAIMWGLIGANELGSDEAAS